MYAQEPCLVLQVVPPRTASSRDIAALETVMQGLALDTRHPIALEIARTESGRQFLLRATSRAALEHLAAQIQARYPQAIIQPLASDPLILKPGEIVTAVELRPGAASYLPLRAFRERELPTEGTDPLLGLLAAMSHVPAQHTYRDATGAACHSHLPGRKQSVGKPSSIRLNLNGCVSVET